MSPYELRMVRDGRERWNAFTFIAREAAGSSSKRYSVSGWRRHSLLSDMTACTNSSDPMDRLTTVPRFRTTAQQDFIYTVKFDSVTSCIPRTKYCDGCGPGRDLPRFISPGCRITNPSWLPLETPTTSLKNTYPPHTTPPTSTPPPPSSPAHMSTSTRTRHSASGTPLFPPLLPPSFLASRRKIDRHIMPFMCSTSQRYLTVASLMPLPHSHVSVCPLFPCILISPIPHRITFMDKTTLGEAAILGIECVPSLPSLRTHKRVSPGRVLT